MADTNPQTSPQQEEVTIKFSRNLMGSPFTSRSGTELVEIQIPNADSTDKRPWESFVVPANRVHENQFSNGNGMWMKLPADRTTNLTRSIRDGTDADGKPTWKKETRTVTNRELKGLVEFYKTASRDSVLGKLDAQHSESRAASDKPPRRQEASR